MTSWTLSKIAKVKKRQNDDEPNMNNWKYIPQNIGYLLSSYCKKKRYELHTFFGMCNLANCITWAPEPTTLGHIPGACGPDPVPSINDPLCDHQEELLAMLLILARSIIFTQMPQII